MEWHRFKDMATRLETMYEHLRMDLERLHAILVDILDWLKATEYTDEMDEEEEEDG